jgi:molecular chaperone GrpE
MTEEIKHDEAPPNGEAATDDRFEVKWRKKNEPTPRAAENPATETAAPAEDVATLQKELEAERERTKALQDRWQRAAADLANLRRRTEEERGEMEKFSSMVVVQEILPVVDNFDRALATIPGNLAMLTWVQGVMLIERHLLAILERQGLSPINVEGRTFTPYEMDAVAERETDEATPGTVLQEYQKGYTMHGRVIRPALVEVAKAPTSPTPETTDTADAEAIADSAETENTGP